jgi:hypothetical protein
MLKHFNAHSPFSIGRFALDLDIVATQFFLSGLKFFLYHKWVFPVAKERPSTHVNRIGPYRAWTARAMNGIIALIVIGLGLLFLCVGGIWSIVVAFQRSIVWGLCYLFVPFASLVFLFVAWAEVRRAFFIQIAGCALVLIPFYLPNQGGLDIQKRLTDYASAELGVGKKGATAPAAPAVDPNNTVFAELAVREKELQERKAALNPKDTIAARQLTEEILRYNADLKTATDAKQKLQQQQQQGAVASAASRH